MSETRISEAYPFDMTLLGHKERLTWLVGTFDRVTNVVQYAEAQVALHNYPAQDGRYVQGIILELINHHKREIARLEEEAQAEFTIPTVDEALAAGDITEEEAAALRAASDETTDADVDEVPT
jgi:BioD-like phosphotransacetylase family protein